VVWVGMLLAAHHVTIMYVYWKKFSSPGTSFYDVMPARVVAQVGRG
jgi:hypothetical protein